MYHDWFVGSGFLKEPDCLGEITVPHPLGFGPKDYTCIDRGSQGMVVGFLEQYGPFVFVTCRYVCNNEQQVFIPPQRNVKGTHNTTLLPPLKR